MPTRDERNRSYATNGDGLASLTAGFDAIDMPNNRRAMANELIEAVTAANDVALLRWYVTNGTDEIACYWEGCDVNVLWATRSEVHILNDPTRVRAPSRAFTWDKQDRKYRGWLLPGAERGQGGGARKATVTQALCPKHSLTYPAGQECPYCQEHHADAS